MARPNVNINWGLANQLQAYTKERSRLQEEQYKVQKDRDTKRSKMGQAWRDYVQYNTDMGIELTPEMIAGWGAMQSGDKAIFDQQYPQAVRDAVIQAQKERLRQTEQDRSFSVIKKNAEQLEQIQGLLGDSLIGATDYRQVFIDVFGEENGPALFESYGAQAEAWEQQAKQKRIEEVLQRGWAKTATTEAEVDANLEGAPNWLKDAIKQQIKARKDKTTKDAGKSLRIEIEKINPETLIGTTDAALQAKLDNLLAAYGQTGNAELRAQLLILLQAKAEQAKRLGAKQRTQAVWQYILDNYDRQKVFDWSDAEISARAKEIARAIDPDMADDETFLAEIEGSLRKRQEGGEEDIREDRQAKIDQEIFAIQPESLANRSDEDLRYMAQNLAKQSRQAGDSDYVNSIFEQLKTKRDGYLKARGEGQQAALNAKIAGRTGEQVVNMTDDEIAALADQIVGAYPDLAGDKDAVTAVIEALKKKRDQRGRSDYTEGRTEIFNLIRQETGWQHWNEATIKAFVDNEMMNQGMENTADAAKIVEYIKNAATIQKSKADDRGEQKFWEHYRSNVVPITRQLMASETDTERLKVLNGLRRQFGLDPYANMDAWRQDPNLDKQTQRQIYEAEYEARKKAVQELAKTELGKMWGVGSTKGEQEKNVNQWFADELSDKGLDPILQGIIYTLHNEYYIGTENVARLREAIYELSKEPDVEITPERISEIAEKAGLTTRAQYERDLYEGWRRHMGIGPEPGSNQDEFNQDAINELENALKTFNAGIEDLKLRATQGQEPAARLEAARSKVALVSAAERLLKAYQEDMKHAFAYKEYDQTKTETTVKQLQAIIERMKALETVIEDSAASVNTPDSPNAVDQISGVSQAEQTAINAANAVAELDDTPRLDQTSNLGQVENHLLANIKALSPKIEFAANEARELEQRLNDLLAEQGVINFTAAQVVSDPQLLARFAGNPIITQLLVLANGIADTKDRKYGFEQEIIELKKQLEQLRADQVGEPDAE